MQYWNIHEVLPYQRNFMLINGERSIGKTYTTQKWVMEKCLKRDSQFVYIVRTQDEKNHGVFENAYKKVMMEQFPDHDLAWDNEVLTIDGAIKGWCLALSESQKIKKRSFPLVDYMIFDEYMIEKNSVTKYVKGFGEPDLLLSIYHTIDRDEDRVKVFMLGNNTTFFNPYHIHKAFNVKQIKKGGIWAGKNVLYQWAQATDDVKKKKAKSKFGAMIEGTEYGDFANDGKYIEDDESFIAVHPGTARYSFTIIVDGIHFGIYSGLEEGKIYVSDKADIKHPIKYALTLDDQSENVLITKVKNAHIKWFSQAIKLGLLRYESMLIKKVCERAIYSLV